jgi:RNA polymerase sigma-70 factor (ECF subfamily)
LAICGTETRAAPLAERAEESELPAFEDLYRTHAGRVYALCLRMTGDPARAEDLMQETFVRAWSHRSSYRGPEGLSSWLRTIAANLVISDHRARRRRRWKEGVLEDALLEEAPAEPREPGPALDLERAIAGLPVGAREVFVLHDVEGLKHEEIARLVGIAVGTSKAQLHRARRLLREALER